MEYNGSCHCKAIQFTFNTSKIVAALKCNCSICSRKNAVMSLEYLEPQHFKLIKGQHTLSTYVWGDKDVNHYFCSNCGVYPFHDSIYDPGKYRINLCCVEELNIDTLEISYFDGKTLL